MQNKKRYPHIIQAPVASKIVGFLRHDGASGKQGWMASCLPIGARLLRNSSRPRSRLPKANYAAWDHSNCLCGAGCATARTLFPPRSSLSPRKRSEPIALSWMFRNAAKRVAAKIEPGLLPLCRRRLTDAFARLLSHSKYLMVCLKPISIGDEGYAPGASGANDAGPQAAGECILLHQRFLIAATRFTICGR